MRNVPTSLTVSHVADQPRRYPGEPVVLHTRVQALQPIAGFSLRIALPAGLALEQASCTNEPDCAPADLLFLEGQQYVQWSVERPVDAGESIDFQLRGAIEQTAGDLLLTSRALVLTKGTSRKPDWDEETACIQVSGQARYIKYLPAVYAEQDELMGRFLMLFESVWTPLGAQIDAMHHYLDPLTAPAGLLPWLAHCVDLALSDQWTEPQRRRLIASALPLYRRRGTRRGLQDFLEIYTGQRPQIVEHRANNLRLGSGSRLSTSVALGQRNIPHTFTVVLSLAPVQAATSQERSRKEADRQRMVEAIIEAEKPAHTAYTLQIQAT
jgi:phage tail-like protein